MGTFTSELTFGQYEAGSMSETPSILYKTVQFSDGAPAPSSFTTLTSSGASYSAPYQVLTSSGSSHTVSGTVLNSTGAPYSPI